MQNFASAKLPTLAAFGVEDGAPGLRGFDQMWATPPVQTYPKWLFAGECKDR